MTLHVVSNFSLRALHVLRITCMYIYQECHSLSQTFPIRNLVVITHHILKSENFQNHANKSAKIFFNFPGYTNSSKEFLESNHYSLFLAYWLLSSKYPSKTVLREFPKPVSLWHYTSCFNLVHKFYALKMPHTTLHCCFESRICVYKILKKFSTFTPQWQYPSLPCIDKMV